MKRMRVMGFGANNNSDNEQLSQQESKNDYVRMALDAYFEGDTPGDDPYSQCVDFLSSKDIQEAISGMVVAPISTITEYMVEHGFKMKSVEGGRLVWIIKCAQQDQ